MVWCRYVWVLNGGAPMPEDPPVAVSGGKDRRGSTQAGYIATALEEKEK